HILLENLLEIFFIWTGFKPAARKDDEFSAKRSMQPLDVCLLKEFGTAVTECNEHRCRRRTGKGYEIGRSRYLEHAGNAPKLIHDSDVSSTHAL
ncbi:hypothetical protein ALC53_01213, partial [Atta colombica]